MTNRTRKTVNIANAVGIANVYLAGESTDPVSRMAVAGFLQALLFSANAYAGFRYLPSELDSDGTLRPDYDDSRRAYFVHASLT